MAQPALQLTLKSLAPTGCLTLFAMPFAAVGVFTSFQAASLIRSGRTREGLFLILFAVVFGGVGFGLFGLALFGRRTLRAAEALKAQHPDAPWLWREDWARGIIRSGGRSTAVGAWFFAFFWNIISGTVVIMVLPRELARGNHAALFALLFPAIGLGLLIWALWAWPRASPRCSAPRLPCPSFCSRPCST